MTEISLIVALNNQYTSHHLFFFCLQTFCDANEAERHLFFFFWKAILIIKLWLLLFNPV